jgi:hypothetical protein
VRWSNEFEIDDRSVMADTESRLLNVIRLIGDADLFLQQQYFLAEAVVVAFEADPR